MRLMDKSCGTWDGSSTAIDGVHSYSEIHYTTTAQGFLFINSVAFQILSVIRLTILQIPSSGTVWSSEGAPAPQAAVPLLRIPPGRYIASNMWRSHRSKLWHSPWVCCSMLPLNVIDTGTLREQPPCKSSRNSSNQVPVCPYDFQCLKRAWHTKLVDGTAKWGCDQWLIIHDARLAHVGLKVASSENRLFDAHSKNTKAESAARLLVAKNKAKWLVWSCVSVCLSVCLSVEKRFWLTTVKSELNCKSEHIETRRNSESKGSKYHAWNP